VGLLKKILVVMMMIIIIVTMTFPCNNKRVYAQVINENQTPVKVGVLLYRFDDVYISLVRQSLEEIQKNNEGKVEFTFYDVKSAQEVINRIKQYNMPVILFNREPLNMNSVQSYNKAYFVGTNSAEAGALQGKVLIDAWNKNKAAIDTDGDNILKYIMLMGEKDNKEAIQRTEYSISTINDAGIQTKQLALTVGDWNRDVAKANFENLFLFYDGRIEAIISNNDDMAIGAIEVLQKYGYNKGPNTKTIAVVGVDAIPEAQELIKQGVMTGSVLQDAPAMAEASYTIGMNLVNGREPLEGTPYKFDDTGVAVRIPYREYRG
jgi:methyl-galactoside transport system substrate-binding protein